MFWAINWSYARSAPYQCSPVNLTFLSLRVPFPLGAEGFPVFFLAKVGIRKGTDKTKNEPLGINDWQASNLLILKESAVYYLKVCSLEVSTVLLKP